MEIRGVEAPELVPSTRDGEVGISGRRCVSERFGVADGSCAVVGSFGIPVETV